MTCEELLGIAKVPDRATLSRWDDTYRFRQVRGRFHRHLQALLPEREVVAAVDPTGCSDSEVPWATTPYPTRATGQRAGRHRCPGCGLVLGRDHNGALDGP